MGHTHDFWETVRHKLAPPIGRLVTGISRAETTDDQFVGYVEMGEEEFEEELHEMGFERNPLAYWKYIPGVGEEQGSWRKNDGKWQLHVILYDGHPNEPHEDHGPRTYVYAHWEYRWDVHPIKHIRGIDQDRTKGINEMRRELQMASIPFYNDVSIQ